MYENAITRGAATLDAYFTPKNDNWRARINVDDLNMTIVTHCVVGQAFYVPTTCEPLTDVTKLLAKVLYNDALTELGAPPSPYVNVRDERLEWQANRGFDLLLSASHPIDAFNLLTNEWRNYVIQTRQPVSA